MSHHLSTTVHCLCNKVSMKIETVIPNIGACHCSMCRTWSGGPLLAVDCQSNVIINDKQAISTFNSSEWAERAFCRHCGTHLYYMLKESSHYMVPVGLFDDEIKFTFSQQIFIDEKPDYYDFINATNNMTGEEVLAHFTAQHPSP